MLLVKPQRNLDSWFKDHKILMYLKHIKVYELITTILTIYMGIKYKPEQDNWELL